MRKFIKIFFSLSEKCHLKKNIHKKLFNCVYICMYIRLTSKKIRNQNIL